MTERAQQFHFDEMEVVEAITATEAKFPGSFKPLHHHVVFVALFNLVQAHTKTKTAQTATDTPFYVAKTA